MLGFLNDLREKDIEKLFDLKPIQKFFIFSLYSNKNSCIDQLKNIYSQLEESDIREFAEREGCQSILYSAFKEIMGESNVPSFWKKEREKTRKEFIYI